jgi:hypothetical protein
MYQVTSVAAVQPRKYTSLHHDPVNYYNRFTGLKRIYYGAVIGMAGYCKQSYKEITKQ